MSRYLPHSRKCSTRRVSRRRACLLAAVMLGSSACADHGDDQASASPVPTFLTDQTLCEVVPRQLLENGLGFYPTAFSYWHSPGHNSSRDIFNCRIYGIRMPQGLQSSLAVSYFIGGKLGAGAGGARSSPNSTTRDCPRSPSTTPRAAAASGPTIIAEDGS